MCLHAENWACFLTRPLIHNVVRLLDGWEINFGEIYRQVIHTLPVTVLKRCLKPIILTAFSAWSRELTSVSDSCSLSEDDDEEEEGEGEDLTRKNKRNPTEKMGAMLDIAYCLYVREY